MTSFLLDNFGNSKFTRFGKQTEAKRDNSQNDSEIMFRDLSAQLEVACSVEEVYNFWNNMENVPRWIPLVKEIKIVPGKEELLHWKFGPGFPLLTEWTSHITKCIPQKLIVWESVSGLPNRGCAKFFPTEHGCRLCLTLSFELPGGIIGAFLETVGIDRWLRANLVESLNRFQSLVEEEGVRKKR
jgi:uncharacterized membrane protein